MCPLMIDIIIATYQRYDLLPLTLKSVQGQTFKDWRCWISEDGNAPETRRCLEPFLADSRFIHLTGEHAGFPARPRNRAIRAGTAPYIAILDDDDLWLPEKLEKQITFLEGHPGCVMAGTNGYRWDGGAQDPEGLPLYHQKIPHGKIDINLLLTGNCFIASSVLLRRDALLKSGLFNEKLHPPVGEDIELWYRLAAVGELWFMEDPLLLYRDLPPKYYDTLTKRELDQWRVGLLEAVLQGSSVPSPLGWPANARLKKLFEDRIEYFRTGPHLLGRTGYRLKKLLGLLPAGQDR